MDSYQCDLAEHEAGASADFVAGRQVHSGAGHPKPGLEYCVRCSELHCIDSATATVKAR